MTVDTLLSKKISEAVLRYGMIEEGDKILVAVSGGKDSMSLTYNLMKMKNTGFPINFDFTCIHIKTDFCNCGKKTRMEKFLEAWGVDYEIKQVPVIARLKPGRKMNCYWCSTQRRMELIKSAEEKGCNKIALGHHMDDILETFFMNMSYKGELSTMLPVLEYDNYPFTVIRPLALVKEQDVIRFATKNRLNKLVCTCPYGRESKRKDMRAVINDMAEGDESIRDNLFKALENPVERYMMGAMNAAVEPAPELADRASQWVRKEGWKTVGPEDILAPEEGKKKLPCLEGKTCPEGADCEKCRSELAS